eukprot:gnl/TRDRNA2_/TRDRNA2_56618_c0_seq1.p1 gnl/TRDRNA2_/TRDRNA2_56618_c0~~gnl/TRDRNA2_/TRDRNA2_56618_c0_seq1.p1  ORF type:complete len:113 (+),score=15.82 gnl/TRDRNA2_/TRDRNA2_56618_c0_seq1:35-340(+)
MAEKQQQFINMVCPVVILMMVALDLYFAWTWANPYVDPPTVEICEKGGKCNDVDKRLLCCGMHIVALPLLYIAGDMVRKVIMPPRHTRSLDIESDSGSSSE